MKKSNSVLLGIAVVIIIVVGAYATFHKSSPKTPASSTTSQSKVAAVNNAVLTTKTNSKLGSYLVSTSSGMALYTYGGDSTNTSNCTGSCLAAWPAYQDTGSTTGLPTGVSTIKRTDNGQIQYTYNGKPLYYFASDSAGQVTGNGVSNFSVAVPAVASSSPSSTTTPSSTSSTQSTSSSSSGNAY